MDSFKEATAEQISGQTQADRRSRAADDAELGDTVTIPLIEEQLVLEKRVVETGKVRLHKTVQEFEQQLDEPLAVNTFDIERVILNQVVESAPDIRQEGDTTIYPLVEERLVLSRQLVLKEEVRVTRRLSERRDTQVVTLRRDHLTVERQSSEPQDAEPTRSLENSDPNATPLLRTAADTKP